MGAYLRHNAAMAYIAHRPMSILKGKTKKVGIANSPTGLFRNYVGWDLHRRYVYIIPSYGTEWRGSQQKVPSYKTSPQKSSI